MKQFITLAVALMGLSQANADERIITLDLTQSTTALTFDEDNGAWTGTYDDDAESIESQCFSFVHSSMADYQTWWGFTASNSADNQRQENTIKYQFSNMAKGGIVLDENGAVKKDEYGAPVTSAETPYIVAYYSPFMSKRPVDMTFNDGKAYDAVGVYVNLNSYSYYCIEYGDAFAHAFNNGDKFTLTIHGVAPDESEKEVTVDLASFDNGNLTINRGWKYADRTPLGTINELYFTMSTTDKGAYGDNTPEYFCLDKLMVKDSSGSGVQSIGSDKASISYDRTSHIVNISNAGFAVVYDVTGTKVMSTDNRRFDISSLEAGIYVIKAGNTSLKIAK